MDLILKNLDHKKTERIESNQKSENSTYDISDLCNRFILYYIEIYVYNNKNNNNNNGDNEITPLSKKTKKNNSLPANISPYINMYIYI